jgi:phosphatidylserine/phosphatidylglycerophosphate/cardiolipin synthase-like enzyme
MTQSQRVITTPIALSCTNSATATAPWFVQGTEYKPAQATFKPLVNGEEAFGAVYEAIANAKRTVDIVCWGFQPSMYFKRDGRSPCIGDLLIQQGAKGVIVRVLCWNSALPTGAFTGENNLPGYNFTGGVQSESAQRLYDQYWHRGCLSVEGAGQPLHQRVQNLAFANGPESSPFDPAPTERVGTYVDGYPNVHLKLRDFSGKDRKALDTWLSKHRADASFGAKGQQLVSSVPTHHQKTVVVDYEDPECAVGFVMGHNMLDEYWDTDAHSAQPKPAQYGRNGHHPRQDLSSRLTGPILQSLNANFCQAWDKATGDHLTAARATAGGLLSLRCGVGDGVPVMAQVLRTQSQEDRRDIKPMYLQAVNNATQFIYIENQYFRWPPLADKIKAAAAKQVASGRDPGKHGPIHLFVVTNASDEGIGPGTVNTYRMLDALGRADTIPAVAQSERADALQQQRRELQSELTWEQGRAPPLGLAVDPSSAYGQQQKQARAAYQAHVQALQQQMNDVDKQIKDNNDEKAPSLSIDGLKVHVCSLVAPDSPAGKTWEYVYVHAKLMIVDDVFMTLGSANINTRSMEGDSELNICHERADVTHPLRTRLWRLHTKGINDGASDVPGDAFDSWSKIVKNNAANQANKLAPIASLVGFLYTSAKRSRLD